MSREIKFRLWKKYDEYTEIDRVNLEQFCSYSDDVFTNIDQYTGLKDCNGVEIYEGDIVKGFKTGYLSPKEETGVVEWATKRCAFILKGCKSYKFKNATMASHYKKEVIGNIYQNPELIPK